MYSYVDPHNKVGTSKMTTTKKEKMTKKEEEEGEKQDKKKKNEQENKKNLKDQISSVHTHTHSVSLSVSLSPPLSTNKRYTLLTHWCVYAVNTLVRSYNSSLSSLYFFCPLSQFGPKVCLSIWGFFSRFDCQALYFFTSFEIFVFLCQSLIVLR